MKNYFAVLFLLAIAACNSSGKETKLASKDSTVKNGETTPTSSNTLDTAKYNQLMQYLANGDTTGRWPVKNAPLPLPGAILPFNRVIAYYGNLYSNRMGALGKWPKAEMIPKLLEEVKKWNEADSV